MKLLLFDIDGTLMDSGGAGTRALEAAFKDVLGLDAAISGWPRIPLAGKTDPQIIREVMHKHGLSFSHDLSESILFVYLNHLSREIEGNGKSVKPYIFKALDALSSHEGIAIGLLTGNIETGARIKLSSLGLMDYFKFGAYGSDQEDRNLLLPEAVSRFRAMRGINVEYADCIVIGDTPRDVECAKIHGARALAVATGPYSVSELISTEADAVVEDLGETGPLFGLAGIQPTS